MCLDLKGFFLPNTHTKGLKVYKVVFKAGYNAYYPLYRKYFRYALGVKAISGLDFPKEKPYGGYKVEEGLHSFATLVDAISVANRHFGCYILECEIPEGASSYAGMWFEHESFASNTLIPIREVEF